MPRVGSVDNAAQGQAVGGIDHHLQITKHVFDFLTLEEAQSTDNLIGNAGLNHSFFQQA